MKPCEAKNTGRTIKILPVQGKMYSVIKKGYLLFQLMVKPSCACFSATSLASATRLAS